MTTWNYEDTATSDEDEENNSQGLLKDFCFNSDELASIYDIAIAQATPPRYNKKRKSVGSKSDSSSTKRSKKHSKKNEDKAALLAASNASAWLLFSQSAYVKSMQEEIKKLQQQLHIQEYKRSLVCIYIYVWVQWCT